MVLDFEDPETERHGNFTIAGVGHRGTSVDEAALWRSLDDYADDLEEVAVGDDRYAVMFDVDPDSGEFAYVAGREVESTDSLSAELTAVEIPQATYAVLYPEHETVREMVVEVHEADLTHSGHADADDVHSPVFERYPAGETPVGAAKRELYVPVRED
ncbi:GyrI-like domain-containing protein [Halosimplex salinum]|uniref:GyrI-like domain-containing protein n=1 Tax=Halosimplex salinum TaxID=1710538 RepID=UPI000F4AEAD0|nr:GyrI-like domain-containing protein [Halosimplex salinum]